MKIYYIHSPRTAEVEKKRAAVVEKAAMKVSNKPGLLLRANKISLTECTPGMVNESACKPYRVFLADTDLSNFSNQFSPGPAEARLRMALREADNGAHRYADHLERVPGINSYALIRR